MGGQRRDSSTNQDRAEVARCGEGPVPAAPPSPSGIDHEPPPPPHPTQPPHPTRLPASSPTLARHPGSARPPAAGAATTAVDVVRTWRGSRRMSRTGDGGSDSGFDDCWGESGRDGDWRPASEVTAAGAEIGGGGQRRDSSTNKDRAAATRCGKGGIVGCGQYVPWEEEEAARAGV